MIRCRLAYVALFCAVLVFHACYWKYFSWYLLILTILAPIFSLLCSLPLRRKLRLACSAPSQTGRGGEAVFTCTAKSPYPFTRVRVKVTFYALMTGEARRFRFTLSPWKASHSLPIDTGTCGAIRWQVTSARTYDLLGLFPLPVPPPEGERVLVRPLPAPPDPLPTLPHLGAGLQERLRPKPGGGFAEEHDLRPYRTGDPIRSVHWKLSAKQEELIVREALVGEDRRFCLDFSLPADARERDSVLDQLCWLSAYLCGENLPHMLRWPEGDVLRQAPVDSLFQLDMFMEKLLSSPLPPPGTTPPSAGAWRYTIRPQSSQEEDVSS